LPETVYIDTAASSIIVFCPVELLSLGCDATPRGSACHTRHASLATATISIGRPRSVAVAATKRISARACTHYTPILPFGGRFSDLSNSHASSSTSAAPSCPHSSCLACLVPRIRLSLFRSGIIGAAAGSGQQSSGGRGSGTRILQRGGCHYSWKIRAWFAGPSAIRQEQWMYEVYRPCG
jgi:hypothetical protein